MIALLRLQTLGLRAAVYVLRCMSPVRASNFGGKVVGFVGPYLGVSRVAHSNLRFAMPEMSQRDRERIVKGVWDNIGRTAAELPHLGRFARCADGPGWEIAGEEHLDTLKRQGGPALFFSAHLANWEIIFPVIAASGLDVAVVYRKASNPLADSFIQSLRNDATRGRVPMFAKGAGGARAALAHLKRGGSLAMMMDQKMNDGVPVAFFGREAMTTSSLASLALRFRCPVIPVHVERLGPARYRLTFEPPTVAPDSGDDARDRADLTLEVNRTLERWIRARPDSWLWLHRRWPKSREIAAPRHAAE